ncbi:hypothetical protein CTAYLR_008843 [Chrysophaeum taylorii]|uniref:Uncharacterized protein n=1 Tax=Chrysophaeum taylorii TaxID=2483200 RepID=A0AAD7XFG0_9STRA|nr:hypothetical protein CTAYLR_008843 [Chrysophaeum taylorii]
MASQEAAPMAYLVWPPYTMQPLATSVIPEEKTRPTTFFRPQNYVVVPPPPPPRFSPCSYRSYDQSACLICLQPTPAVSAARGVHVRALLLCTCIRMMRDHQAVPVPDVRRKYAKSCRACRYWLELGIKKIESLTKSAGVNIQDLLAAQSRFWAASNCDANGPVLGFYSPHPEDMRPRSLRKPLIDFVKKNVTVEMVTDFQLRLSKVAPARRVTLEGEEEVAPPPHPPIIEDLVVVDDDDDDEAVTPKFFNI